MTRFAFGKNWASYAETVGEAHLAAAGAGLRRLLGDVDLAGRSFLDIGCGSGIHSAAAIRLGAASVVAVDVDADAVNTTRAVLARFVPGAAYRVEQRSVLELHGGTLGPFDVVYAWGVLHHTGDMVAALGRAVAMVAPGGVFLFALYRRTYLCSLWRLEKRWYAATSPRLQRLARLAYIRSYRLFRRARLGQRYARAGFDGVQARGMDFQHDVHDWLGGFPYESILPDEVDRLMRSLGLRHQATFPIAATAGRTYGLLGSGCDEYRYGR